MRTTVDDLRYARDVLAAYDFFGRKLDTSKLGPSAAEIHLWASEPSNRKDFFAMVQKATDQIAKHSKENTPDDQLKAEYKSISELKVFLAKALEEALRY